MHGRRRAAQFATLAPMCSPALTFAADGDGSERGKGRRLCGLAISQDGREMEGERDEGGRKKENKSIRLPVRCCYMAAFPLRPSSAVAHPAPLPSRSLFLSLSVLHCTKERCISDVAAISIHLSQKSVALCTYVILYTCP